MSRLGEVAGKYKIPVIATVGVLSGVMGISGAIETGNPLDGPKLLAQGVKDKLNSCEPLEQSKIDAMTKALEAGRASRASSSSMTTAKKAGEAAIALEQVVQAPDLSHAKDLINEATTTHYGFETKVGDLKRDEGSIKEDVTAFATNLINIPPELVKNTILDAVELNSEVPGNENLLASFRGIDRTIYLTPSTTKRFSHELGHSVVFTSTANHCSLTGTLEDPNYDIVNPPTFTYGTNANRDGVTTSDYGASDKIEDPPEVIERIINANKEASFCLYGDAPVTDQKLAISLARINELAPAAAQEYAHEIGQRSDANFCG